MMQVNITDNATPQQLHALLYSLNSQLLLARAFIEFCDEKMIRYGEMRLTNMVQLFDNEKRSQQHKERLYTKIKQQVTERIAVLETAGSSNPLRAGNNETII